MAAQGDGAPDMAAQSSSMDAARSGKKARLEEKKGTDAAKTKRLSGPSNAELQRAVEEKDEKIQELEKKLQVSHT